MKCEGYKHIFIGGSLVCECGRMKRKMMRYGQECGAGRGNSVAAQEEFLSALN